MIAIAIYEAPESSQASYAVVSQDGKRVTQARAATVADAVREAVRMFRLTRPDRHLPGKVVAF